MSSLNFDPLVEQYDETRVVDSDNLVAAVRWLAERYPPTEYPQLLEPGIGTGRIAIPLAECGYSVRGVDISQRMLAALADHLAEQGTPLRVSGQLADVQRLPFPSASFNIIVAVHLFYFMQEWKLAVDELLRVLRPDCPMVLMHTGMGMEIPFVNDYYKEYCAQQGFRVSSLGVSSTER